MLNRTEQPLLKSIDQIDFVAPKKHPINDHVNLYHMKDVNNETTRIDIYFDAGKCRGENGIPAFVSGLLLSGTDEKSSVQIHNEINGLGGFFEAGLSVENSVITLYCLRENAQAIFSTIIDAIKNVNFDPNEVEQLISERKQKFDINLEKVSYLAQRTFQEQLFASNEIYSSTLKQSDFENAEIDALKSFHKEHYLNGLSKVVVVGDLDQSFIEHIIESCAPIASKKTIDFVDTLENNKGEFIHEKEGAIQTAIRVGRILFNKNNDDYLEFLVLHTLLGDYFGSRLMSNIREDKGYTYGIGTALPELQNTGYFLTVTEVRKDVRDETLKEIKYEFERLQQELVPADELELVKNYMLGQLLKSADGPYAMTDLYMSAEVQGKGLDFYNEAIKAIQSITPERVQELAKHYLNWDDLTVVAYG